MRDLVVFGVLRIAMWALAWWLLMLAGIGPLLAAVLAALITMLISIVVLEGPRHRAALRWKEADERRRVRRGEIIDEDAAAEDAAVDHDFSRSTSRSGSSAVNQSEPIESEPTDENPPESVEGLEYEDFTEAPSTQSTKPTRSSTE